MFKSMRRIQQQLQDQEAVEILEKHTYGILSLLSEDEYPYGLPLNYVKEGNKLYFHVAKVGHKIDALHHCRKASFCVVDQDQVIPEELTTYYKSVIAFGKVSIIEDLEDKYHAMDHLIARFNPLLNTQERKEAILPSFDRVELIQFEIEHLTGKQAKKLALIQSSNL